MDDNLSNQKTYPLVPQCTQGLTDIEAIIASIDDNTKLLRLPDVEEIIGFKSTHIYKLIKEGHFPAPIKLGRRQAVWLSTQITDWKKRVVRENLEGEKS